MKNLFRFNLKRILLIVFISSTFTFNVWSQAPFKMSFQAVIRNSSNVLIKNTNVAMLTSIIQGSPSGTVVFAETHTPTTNENGLVTIFIGGGFATGTTYFKDIDWANGPYYIKTETDPLGGTNYTIVGTSELLSVPYALYAGNGTAGPAGPTGPQGPPGLAGADGLQGPTGPTGPTGLDGASGLQGLPGVSGAAGATGATGPTGSTGASGANGATGPAGLNGNTVLNGTTIPGAAIGVNGDFYLNTLTNQIFGPKTAGTWGAGVSLVGPAGATGATGLQGATGPTGATGATGVTGTDGKTILNGITAPLVSLGVNGDFYINTLTNQLYGPKTAGVWGSGISLIGPQGVTGNTGATGPIGTTGVSGLNGKTVLNGPVDPNPGTGNDGDFYLNTSTYNLFGPSLGGSWGFPASLIGPTGTQGAAGRSLLNGTVDPGPATGKDGDFYINTSTYDIFGPKSFGNWGVGTSIVGPQGLIGPTGPQGVQGAEGKTILNGIITPTAGIGKDSDFYINTATSLLYGPKTSGAWGSGLSLIGPAGTYTAGRGITIATGVISASHAVATITSNTTLDDTYSVVLCNNSSAFSVTLPSSVGITGRIYTIKNINTGIVTINTTSSQTIDAAVSGALRLDVKNNLIQLVSDGANWSVVNHPVHYIGESYGGGIVFFVFDGGLHGLISSTSDQFGSPGVRWYGGSNINTRARADGVGAGKSNTLIGIANQATVDISVGAFAASVCNEYSVSVNGVTYGDWYLPSKSELNLLFGQQGVVGGFSGNYWSSTEANQTNAWIQNFSTSTQSSAAKSTLGVVRAIRSF